MPLTKVVFSPCLFELMASDESKATELAHLNYLQSLLGYLVKLDIEFDLYENAPYYPDSLKRPPITRYHYFKVSYSQLYAKIQKKIAYSSFVSLSSYSPSEIISEYTYPDKSETKDSFLRYITYLQKNSKKSILFIGEPNSTKKRPFLVRLPDGKDVEITPIYEPDTDCSGQIGGVLPIADDTSPFPNGSFCYALNDEFLRGRSGGDKTSLIRRYGLECASRNGYVEDSYLSFLNSKKQRGKRNIFRKGGKNGCTYHLTLKAAVLSSSTIPVHIWANFLLRGIKLNVPDESVSAQYRGHLRQCPCCSRRFPADGPRLARGLCSDKSAVWKEIFPHLYQ